MEDKSIVGEEIWQRDEPSESDEQTSSEESSGQPLRAANKRFSKLPALFQRLSELANKQIVEEVSASLRWYMAGWADAHEMDAKRAREALDPTVVIGPEDAATREAYKTVLTMHASLVADENGAANGKEDHGLDE